MFDILADSQNLENGAGNGKWFMEIDKDYTDLATTMKMEYVLHHAKSKYQDILIFNKYPHEI